MTHSRHSLINELLGLVICQAFRVIEQAGDDVTVVMVERLASYEAERRLVETFPLPRGMLGTR